MRIRTNIFIWVFLATIVPLTALALGAVHFSESSYQQIAQNEISRSQGKLSSELTRHLDYYVSLADGMARSPAVQDLLPSLRNILTGSQRSDFNIQRSRVNHYFEGFQTILPGGYFLRILDTRGNSLIKVTHQSRSAAVYEAVDGVSYVEREISSPHFVRQLRDLPAGEVSPMRLPQNRYYDDLYTSLQLHDYVVPLYHKKRFVGAISLTVFGEQLDQAARNTTRVFEGNIFIVQNSPEQAELHGLVLYDFDKDLEFIQARDKIHKIDQYYPDAAGELLSEKAYGEFDSDDNEYRYYYTELHPYNNKFLRWMLVTKIKKSVISEPFTNIRLAIWLCAAIALVVTLLLAGIGTRKLAQPVCELAGKLMAYANGNYKGRIETRQGIDEIDSLTDAFNYMADTLHRTRQDRDQAEHMMLQNAKLASIGQMAAGIGHELNNPLNNILSYAKLVERDTTDNEDVQKDIHSLREEANRASGIVKGILNFARQVPPEYSSFNVSDWIIDSCALVNQMAKTASITINTEVDYQGELEGDRSQLQQVMVNLLLNAVHASSRDSEIDVNCQQQGDSLIITVQDHGTGIPADVLDKIYDPFFTTRPEGEGNGLGLSISLGIVERHGGKLQVESPVGSPVESQHKDGTLARITLPLHSENTES